VIFPPSQDVQVNITYTGEPYDEYKSGFYGYSYVLITGAAWNGTIGSAEMTIHLPYTLDAYNYYRCMPDTCSIIGNEVYLHFDNFEPSSEGITEIEADFVPPPIWLKVLTERANTTNNPKDGEAWGRLGKAYKEAMGGAPYPLLNPTGLEMYQWSVEAYQKALELLPNDADWHYGYANLLCNKAIWNDGGITYPDQVDWGPCLEQLQQALTLNPKHELAQNLVGELNRMGVAALKKSLLGTFVFTPSPTINPLITPTVTQTRVPTFTHPPTLTPIITPSVTQTSIPTHTKRPTITLVEANTAESTTTTLPMATNPPTQTVELAANLHARVQESVPATPHPSGLTVTPSGAVVPDKVSRTHTPVGLLAGIGIVILVLAVTLVVTRLRRG
jgi:hypothetical protein